MAHAPTIGFGLRGKSLVALLFACALALIPAGLFGWQALDSVRSHFGSAYARNLTRLNAERILAPVTRELALSQRLAASVLTRRFLRDPDDADARALLFEEAEGYRHAFRDRALFVIAADGRYYYNDDSAPVSDQPRYRLDPAAADDGWFFATMRGDGRYNINVNPDLKLKTTRVWFNVVVIDAGARLGLAGTGLDLTGFLRDFVGSGEPGVTPMIVNADGAIQAHPDRTLIAYDSSTGGSAAARTVFTLLAPADVAPVRAALAQAQAAPGEIVERWAELDGRPQLLALAWIPELGWHVLTAVDLGAARVIDDAWVAPALIAFALLLAALLVGFGFAVERLVLRPLRRLQQSAAAIADGHYEVALPRAANDEIGMLSQAFGVMADKVRSHTEELESKVRQRTEALEAANRAMAAAHQTIDDSIGYASLIQRAFLPDRQLDRVLGAQHCVLWRPRDVVGGDFYVFHQTEHGFLIGIVDCAGHGVAGALMTMLTTAAIDRAVADAGAASPAEVLTRADRTMRAMLQDTHLPRGLATTADAALVHVDRRARVLRFAGARIALYWTDGADVAEVRGARRALHDDRAAAFEDAELDLAAGRTYCLVTDGLLDQAGGEHGYGFGRSRFCALLREVAARPLAEQMDAFAAALADYQGSHPQRDDITLLLFRTEA